MDQTWYMCLNVCNSIYRIPRCVRNCRIMRCGIIFNIHCFTVTSHRFALLMMFVLGFARSVWTNIQIFILRFFLYKIYAHYFFTDVFQCIFDIIFTTITFITVNFFNISLCLEKSSLCIENLSNKIVIKNKNLWKWNWVSHCVC